MGTDKIWSGFVNNFEIKLDKISKVKLYHQLYLFFVNAIKNKELPEETKLPSIRTLSEDYNISRNTVTKAYSELEANGYIYSLSKSGFFVKNPSSTEPSLLSKEKSEDEGIPTVESIIKEKEQKEKKKNKKIHHLIVTIIAEGYSEKVMNTAKNAGAGGGTLINGRSIYQTNSKRQFLGFSIEPEKDLILIVTEEAKKNDIMNAIVKETGLKTEGGGIIFSLPITEAIGLFEENN